MKTCRCCGHEFDETKLDFKFESRSFCSEKCKDNYLSYSVPYKNKKMTDPNEYTECKICGVRSSQISKHIKAYHMPIYEYCNLYNLAQKDLLSKNEKIRKSERMSSLIKEGKITGFTTENNPSYSSECKNGTRSPFSKNFKKYSKYNEDEKNQVISDLKSKSILRRKENCNDTTNIDYYLKRGMTQKEAYFALKERQSTFSLKRCMERYGKEDGMNYGTIDSILKEQSTSV